MAKYVALIEFADIDNGEHVYLKGDEYIETDPKRTEYLLGSHNVTGAPVIALVEEEKQEAKPAPKKAPKKAKT